MRAGAPAGGLPTVTEESKASSGGETVESTRTTIVSGRTTSVSARGTDGKGREVGERIRRRACTRPVPAPTPLVTRPVTLSRATVVSGVRQRMGTTTLSRPRRAPGRRAAGYRPTSTAGEAPESATAGRRRRWRHRQAAAPPAEHQRRPGCAGVSRRLRGRAPSRFPVGSLRRAGSTARRRRPLGGLARKARRCFAASGQVALGP